MSSRSSAPVAELCLYGTSVTGAGYLVRTADGRLFGDGEPRQTRSFTDAIWLACDALCQAGIVGRVVVYRPDGLRMAFTDVARPASYGALVWEPAPVYVLTDAALIAAGDFIDPQ